MRSVLREDVPTAQGFTGAYSLMARSASIISGLSLGA